MKVLPKRDTEENAIKYNTILRDHELLVVDTKDGIKYKLGNGMTKFIDLPYIQLSEIEFFNVYFRMYHGSTKYITIYLNPFMYKDVILGE